MKIKHVCPYCKRKIKYFTLLTEHNLGEHECNHCKKKSNIKQDSLMWLLLIGTVSVALIIMLLYFLFAKSVNFAHEESGAFSFLCFMFFGKGYEIKWLIWEMLPFVAFYFVSPLFMKFVPQKRFVEQTTTSIDLDVPGVPMVTGSFPTVSGSTIVIPMADEMGEFSGDYENISSSSDIGSTRAFDVTNISAEDAVNINKPKTSTSASYRDTEPLVKIIHENELEDDSEISFDENEEVRVDFTKTREQYTQNTEDTKKTSYSANRKF